MRALRDEPAPVFGRMDLNPHLQLDWERITTEMPGLLQCIRQAQEENATPDEILLPLEVLEELEARGLLVLVEDEAQE